MYASKNSVLVLVLILIIIGCQSQKSFHMKTLEKEELQIVEVDSDRILHECYFLNAEKENNWRHQYFMYILNDNDEVITAMNPTNQDDVKCKKQLKKIEKVLKGEKKVKLCLRELLKKDVSGMTSDVHDFGRLGRHTSPYDALTFDRICNSKECFSMSDTWTVTCPEFKFAK